MSEFIDIAPIAVSPISAKMLIPFAPITVVKSSGLPGRERT
jgi:hypothetical protein